MSQRQRFTGKTALITGGGTGIGAAIAQQFASEGATVALCGRRSDVIQQKVDELTTAGYKAIAVVGDVATDATEIVQNALAALGRLDILVNNAAISAGVPMEEMDNQLWRQVLAVNLDGVFALVHHALPYLVESQGVILHISSISAISGEVDDVAYAASKAGLEGFSRKLALELAATGVRSLVIRPGLIRTEAFANMPPAFFDAQVPLIPLRRVGNPEDIAHAAAFLCSEEANFITGTVLTIDGGESAK